jgi:hypothetical protein
MKLTDIATDLKQVAEKTGMARYRLPRGLVLTLQYAKLNWTLSLTRQGAKPSAKEEEICRQAFDIPTKAKRTEKVEGGFYIVRFSWRGMRQMSLNEISPVETYDR